MNNKLQLRKAQVGIMGVCVVLVLAGSVGGGCQCLGLIPDSDFVGTVVDEVTGEPIEGAIALAFWRKHYPMERWFEGGKWRVSRIEEVRSDKEGKVYIKNFWKGADWLDGGPYYHEIDKYPQLLVYKPGYVAWNHRNIFISRADAQKINKETGYESLKQYTYRMDFSQQNRIIKLERWWEGYSHDEHDSFINGHTPGCIPDDIGYKRVIFNEFRKHELEYVLKEREEQREEFKKWHREMKMKEQKKEEIE